MTSLSSIESLPDESRTRVIADAVLRLTSPLDERGEAGPEVRAVVDDIRQQLADGRSGVWGHLGKELTEEISPPRREAAMIRLVARGLVDPRRMQLIIPRAQFATFAQLGVRRQHIEQAVRGARLAEPVGRQRAFFVFAHDVQHRDPHTLVVGTTLQDGHRLVFEWAFRLYPADVDISDASASELVRRFSEKYGLLFRINKCEPVKYIEHLVLDTPSRELNAHKMDGDGERSFFATIHFATVGGNFVEVNAAFVVDVERYAKTLAAHGVVVGPVSAAPPSDEDTYAQGAAA